MTSRDSRLPMTPSEQQNPAHKHTQNTETQEYRTAEGHVTNIKSVSRQTCSLLHPFQLAVGRLRQSRKQNDHIYHGAARAEPMPVRTELNAQTAKPNAVN